MYSINPFHNPRIAFSDLPDTKKPIWLWILLGIGGYFLLRKEKKKTAQRESQTPLDLRGLASVANPEPWEQPSKYEQKKSWQIPFPQWKAEIERLQDKWYRGSTAQMKEVAKEMKRLGFNPDERGAYKEHYQRMIEKTMPKDAQMQLLGGLGGNLRTCDAWFEVEDKRGFKSHRCFIYKPTCNTKKCKKDPSAIVSRETMPEMQGVSYGLGKIPLKEREGTDVQGFFKGDTNEVWWIDVTPRYNEKLKDWFHSVFTRDSSGDFKPAKLAVSTQSLDEQFLPTFKRYKKIYPEKDKQLTLFGDFYDSINIEPTEILSLSNEALDKNTLRNMSKQETNDLFLKLRAIENKIDYHSKLWESNYQNDRLRSRLREAINVLSKVKGDQFTLFGNISGYTATCLKWGRNRLGRKQCKKYAPTCGSAAKGCRIDPLPIPGSAKEAKAIEKEKEVHVDAMAKMLADDANTDLERNKELMRQILAYGGIAPHKGGFLREEYNELPDKYKRKNGIPLDELAQELGTDETKITEEIYKAQSTFDYLKSLRGGKTVKRFKAEDFINEAWDRIGKGKGFMGVIQKTKEQFYAEQLLQEALNLESAIGTRLWNANSKTWADYYRELANDFLSGKIKADDPVNNAHWKQEFAKYDNLYDQTYGRKKQIPEQTEMFDRSQISLFGGYHG